MITRSDLERFTEGDCWILAKTIHRMTGWKLCAFNAGGYPDQHGFIEMPDGRYLDVEGPSDPKDFCSRWGFSDAREFPYSAFQGLGTTFGNHSYARAKVVARELLDKLGEVR